MLAARAGRDDESTLPTRVLLSRIRCDTAAMTVRLALLRLMLLEKAYNPDQPRVPAGDPDGGQWTDGGFGLLRPRHEPRQGDGEEAQVAQSGRGGLNPATRLGRSWLGATPAQQVRLAVSHAQALTAMARAQRADPSWRPGQGISAATVEGEIARNEALAREAEAHLAGLGRRGPEALSSRNVFAPGGRLVGERERGAGGEVRTAPWDQLRELIDQIATGARAVATPAGYGGQWYRRFDGSVVGVRFSRQHGVTIDIVSSPGSPALTRLKVHSK